MSIIRVDIRRKRTVYALGWENHTHIDHMNKKEKVNDLHLRRIADSLQPRESTLVDIPKSSATESSFQTDTIYMDRTTSSFNTKPLCVYFLKYLTV